jgi:hypothetical protein
VAARAAYHASVRAEAERLAGPLPAGNGEGAAAAQLDQVLVPAAELVEAVSLDARALGYAMPVKRARKTDRRAAAAQVPQVPRATLARRREEAEGPPSYESRAVERQAVAEALEAAREAEAEAPALENTDRAQGGGDGIGPQLMDVRAQVWK